MPIFTGSGVAIVTPMKENGDVNYPVFEKLLEFQIANGTNAIIVCGTTGEATTLSDAEQIECIRFAAEVVNKRAVIVAGAGSNDTHHGIELCKGAEKAGADALLLVTPYYNKCTQKGLVNHYALLAGSVDIPVMVYSVKARTGLNIEPMTALELSKVKNITAIKEASGDVTQIAKIAALVRGKMDIYSGNDDQNLPILALGGVGVISVIANVAPRKVADMTDAFFKGDIAKSRELQLDMMDLYGALFCEVSPIPVKAALNLMGFEVGGCRLPLSKMEDANLQRLEKAMREFGLI